MQRRIGSAHLRAQMAALSIGANTGHRLDELFGLGMQSPELADLVRSDWVLRSYVAARAALQSVRTAADAADALPDESDVDGVRSVVDTRAGAAMAAARDFIRLLSEETLRTIPALRARLTAMLEAAEASRGVGAWQNADDMEPAFYAARIRSLGNSLRTVDDVLAQIGAELFGQLNRPEITDDTRLTPGQIRIWLAARDQADPDARAVLERRSAAITENITLAAAAGNPFEYIRRVRLAGGAPVDVDALLALDLDLPEIEALAEAFASDDFVQIICLRAHGLAPPPAAATVDTARALDHWLTALTGSTANVDAQSMNANADAAQEILDTLREIAAAVDDDAADVDSRLLPLLGAADDDGASADDEPPSKRRRGLDDLDADDAAAAAFATYANAVAASAAIREAGLPAAMRAPLQRLITNLSTRLARYVPFTRIMPAAARLIDALAVAIPSLNRERVYSRVYTCLRAGSGL